MGVRLACACALSLGIVFFHHPVALAGSVGDGDSDPKAIAIKETGWSSFRILEGGATALSDDGFSLSGTRIRLIGTEMPEEDETCGASSFETIWCGLLAQAFLTDRLKQGKAVCILEAQDNGGSKEDRIKRAPAICWMEGAFGITLNEDLVENGYALGRFEKGAGSFSSRLKRLTEIARKKENGLWSNTMLPLSFIKANDIPEGQEELELEITGAFTVISEPSSQD